MIVAIDVSSNQNQRSTLYFEAEMESIEEFTSMCRELSPSAAHKALNAAKAEKVELTWGMVFRALILELKERGVKYIQIPTVDLSGREYITSHSSDRRREWLGELDSTICDYNLQFDD